MTIARKLRERRHRRLLAAGIGASAALHGAVLGLSTFGVPETPAGPEDRANDQPPISAEAPAMELVTLAPTLASAPAQPSSSASAATSPAAGAASPAVAPNPGAESAPISATAMLAAFEARARPTMKANFASLLSVSPGGPSTLPATAGPGDDHAGHDHGREEDDGNSWWRRLGISIGSGGGHCRPKPGGVVVSGPREPVTLR